MAGKVSKKTLKQVVEAFAELERAKVSGRILDGIGRARAAGVPLGRPRISAEKEAAIRAMLATGAGKLRIAKTLGTGCATVQRVAKELAGQAKELSE